MLDDTYKLSKCVQIARLYLEDDDAANAKAFINKASFFVNNSQHEVLNSQYKSLMQGLWTRRENFWKLHFVTMTFPRLRNDTTGMKCISFMGAAAISVKEGWDDVEPFEEQKSATSLVNIQVAQKLSVVPTSHKLHDLCAQSPMQ